MQADGDPALEWTPEIRGELVGNVTGLNSLNYLHDRSADTVKRTLTEEKKQ